MVDEHHQQRDDEDGQHAELGGDRQSSQHPLLEKWPYDDFWDGLLEAPYAFAEASDHWPD